MFMLVFESIFVYQRSGARLFFKIHYFLIKTFFFVLRCAMDIVKGDVSVTSLHPWLLLFWEMMYQM